MIKKLFVLFALASITSGCASVTGSPNQSVSIQTREQDGKEISGAKCDLTNKRGTWFVTTPGSVSIHRSNDDMQIICRKDGHENGRAAVVSETKGSMFGNIILGGGIGAIVDHSNGSAYEYPTFIQIVMGAFTKIEPPPRDPPTNSNPMMGAAPSPTSVPTKVPEPVVEEQANATDSAIRDSESKAAKLEKLKELYEQELITKEVYEEQQKFILQN